jgi:hypothetical protein
VILEKPKLDKYDTAILLAIKNHKVKLKYNYDDQDQFNFIGKNKILNNYKELSVVYADTRAIPLECVQLDYIIRAMLDIFEILKPTKFKELIIDFCKPTFAEEKSINEIIFENLYGYLQVLTMRKDNEDIYDLDMELILD